jgi:hypothetical protein
MADTQVKIDLTGPAFDGRLKAQLVRNVRTALTAGAQRIIATAAPLTPANTGALRASLTYRLETERSGVPGAMPRAMRARVGSPLLYAATMEYGRRPGQRWPPLAAIVLWVRRQLRDEVEQQARAALASMKLRRDAKPRGTRGKLPTIAALRERAVQSMAFLIQRAIAKKGIVERRMLREAIRTSEAWVRGAITAAVRSAIA